MIHLRKITIMLQLNLVINNNNFNSKLTSNNKIVITLHIKVINQQLKMFRLLNNCT